MFQPPEGKKSPARAKSDEWGDRHIVVLPPNSAHSGGVHGSMGEGAVRWFSDNIKRLSG